MTRETPAVSKLQLSVDRARLRWAQAKIGARILRRAIGHSLEPQVYEDRDFGNYRDKGRQATRVANDAREAAAILAEAYASRVPVNVGAATHSSNGPTLSRGGIRLLLNAETWTGPRMIEGDRVDAPAPMTWGALEAFLQARGRGCPVLTDHLGTSVGGTLSVGGGIGTRSVVGGRQLDQVERLHLLLPTGDTKWVSPTQDPDLFRYILGGQGLLGIIDRVVLRTIPRRPYVTQFRLQFSTLRDAAKAACAFRERNTEPDFSHLDFVGPILDSRVVELTLGFEYANNAQALERAATLPAALAPLESRVFSRGVVKDLANHNHARSASYMSLLTSRADPHVFLWNDFFFTKYGDYDRFLQYAEEVAMPRVGNRYLMAALGLGYPHFEGRPVVPMSGLVTAEGELAFSIGFNYAVPKRDLAGQTTIQTLLDEFQREAPRLGGRMYRYGYSNANEADLRELYGQDYTRLLELKAEVDPENLVNPDVFR